MAVVIHVMIHNSAAQLDSCSRLYYQALARPPAGPLVIDYGLSFLLSLHAGGSALVRPANGNVQQQQQQQPQQALSLVQLTILPAC